MDSTVLLQRSRSSRPFLFSIGTGASVMKLRFVLGSAPLLATVLMAATAAHADTFDVRSNAAHGHRSDVPQRGMTMAQVEQAYGAPVDKLPTAGGDAPR